MLYYNVYTECIHCRSTKNDNVPCVVVVASLCTVSHIAQVVYATLAKLHVSAMRRCLCMTAHDSTHYAVVTTWSHFLGDVAGTTHSQI